MRKAASTKIFSYICEDDPQAALHVCERIEGRVSALAQFPYSGRIGRVEDTRELVIAGTALYRGL